MENRRWKEKIGEKSEGGMIQSRIVMTDGRKKGGIKIERKNEIV